MGRPSPAREEAIDLSRNLLGIRLGCAACHDHPYDRWTVQDLYGLAAFFARDRIRQGPGAGKVELGVPDEGELRIGAAPGALDRDAQVKLAQEGIAAPVLLFGGQAAKNDDRLKALAGLMTSKANTQLARAFVNRV
jgi:hypothetical protein